MKETQNIEFKRQWRDDFLAELCGFANAQGGTLYIGVDDKGSGLWRLIMAHRRKMARKQKVVQRLPRKLRRKFLD